MFSGESKGNIGKRRVILKDNLFSPHKSITFLKWIFFSDRSCDNRLWAVKNAKTAINKNSSLSQGANYTIFFIRKNFIRKWVSKTPKP